MAAHRPAPKQGYHLLQDPTFNRGTGFTLEERAKYGIRGLVPPRAFSIDEQLGRVYNAMKAQNTDLEKYIYLMALQDRNETLFYRLVMQHLEECMPLIYTPTVGLACQMYGRIFRRPRGLYVSLEDKGHVMECLNNWPEPNIKVIVVTDGERILGLGDLGAQGMGIPVGKLSLYTACAGIYPHQTLPVTIDIGTNNDKLREDPLYIGLQQKRERGDAYDELVDEFITSCKSKYGENVLIQFEDFGGHNAFRMLTKYKEQACTFNDDIQGTASVSLAGILAATQRINKSKLEDQKFLFLGAGEAGTGIGTLIAQALVKGGMEEQAAKERCWFVDSKGLVVKSRLGDLAEHKVPFAHDHEEVPSLVDAIHKIKPTGLIGVSAQASTFTKEVIEAMCQYNERPIVFALSNPTSKAECTAQEAVEFSNGKAIFASGSPFDTVEFNGKKYKPGQGNNAYIFPGVGLGAVACGAKRITDEMMYIAAQTLANLVTDEDIAQECVYPHLKEIRKCSLEIAVAVAEDAYKTDLATVPRPDDLHAFIEKQMYCGEYLDLD